MVLCQFLLRRLLTQYRAMPVALCCTTVAPAMPMGIVALGSHRPVTVAVIAVAVAIPMGGPVLTALTMLQGALRVHADLGLAIVLHPF